MHPNTFLVAGLVLPLVNAFSDSHPLVAWSSLPSRTLSRVSQDTPAFASANSVVDSLLDVEELCNHDLVIVVSQPGLHANQMRDSRSNKQISSLIEQSSSSFQLPHVTSLSQETVEDFASRLSNRCGHSITKDTLSGSPTPPNKGGKHVLCMEAHPWQQQSNMLQRLDSLTKDTPNHLVILAGVPSKSHSRRQLSHLQDSNSTIPGQGGIFKRYQLFTPTLITALLIFVLVWIPIVFVGLNALASIQTPRIGSIGKPVTSEKKNQ